MTPNQEQSYIDPSIQHICEEAPSRSTPTHEEIERLAYELWEQDHDPTSSPEDYWFEAERSLGGEPVEMSE